MSEHKQLRPRLTKREIQFLVDSLKHTLAVVDLKEQEFKQLRAKAYRLRREIQYNTMVWKELKQTKQELSDRGNFEATALHYRSVCNSLIRRLEGLLKGGKLHTGLWAEYSLSQIYLERMHAKPKHQCARLHAQ